MEELQRAEFLISGLVQGVGFRYFVYRHATEIGLVGFTENLYDGRVLTVVEGKESQISELAQHLRKGPPRSWVESVKVKYSDYSGQFKSFGIK